MTEQIDTSPASAENSIQTQTGVVCTDTTASVAGNISEEFQEKERRERADDTVDSQHLQAKTSGALMHALKSIKQYATFAQLLRLSGAAVIVAAMSLFLLEGVEVKNDLQRYLTLLAHTGILTAAGFMVSYLLRDNKGARVFFGLGLISVPVNFAVLGAMIYSLIPLDIHAVDYPTMMHWQAQNPGSIGIALLTGAAVLLPVTYLGFAIMARPNMRLFGSLNLVACATLLIPVRETVWVILIALALVVIVATILGRHSSASLNLKTMEGRFAQGVIFIPVVLLVGRSLVLYSADTYALLVMCLTAYYVLWQGTRRLDSESVLLKLVYLFSLPLAWCIATTVGYLSSSLPIDLSMPVFVVVFSGLVLELSRNCAHQRRADLLLFVGTALMLGTTALFSPIGWGGGSGIFGVELDALVALAALVYALSIRHFSMALLAAVFLFPHLASHALTAWNSIDFSNWMTLAALGITAVLSASLLERYGACLIAIGKRRKLTAMRKPENALLAESVDVAA